MSWQPFADGASVGQIGSEGGVILRDDEHSLGARITLEQGCLNSPFAVTCGVYGWFFHTRFLGSESEAELPAMRDGLSAILDEIPCVDALGPSAKMDEVCECIQRFVGRFP